MCCTPFRESLTFDSDQVVTLGLSGSVIIFVSPIAVVALPLSGDHIVPVRFPELRKVLRVLPLSLPAFVPKVFPAD